MARTLTDLLAAVDSTGLQSTQVDWLNGTEPDMPYAVIVPGDTSNWFADGVVSDTPTLYMVELYTRVRDVALEVVMQAALNDAGIGWERTTVVPPDGRAVMTRWYAHVFER